MHKCPINTPQAPAAIGPYSQAVKAGNLLFTSGQLPIDPATNEFAGESAADQTRQCLKNLQAILEAAGSSLDKVLKVLVFLTDMSDFTAVNEVYATFFSGDYPARSCVAVKALPKGSKVEIEAVASCD